LLFFFFVLAKIPVVLSFFPAMVSPRRVLQRSRWHGGSTMGTQWVPSDSGLDTLTNIGEAQRLKLLPGIEPGSSMQVGEQGLARSRPIPTNH